MTFSISENTVVCIYESTSSHPLNAFSYIELGNVFIVARNNHAMLLYKAHIV